VTNGKPRLVAGTASAIDPLTFDRLPLAAYPNSLANFLVSQALFNPS